MQSRFAASAIFSLLVAFAAPSGANGRYPSAQQLLVDPADPGRLWLRATYGLVNATGAGAWGWVCEDAVGYSSREDPMVAIAHGGRIFAGAFAGLFTSDDGGCSWSLDPSIGSLFVRDVATDGSHAHVVALTSSPQDNGDYELRVWRSSGEPPAFAPLGPVVSRDLIGFTVDVAPSDPERLYVSAAMWPLATSADAGPPQKLDASPRGPNGPAFLLRSRDGGRTWDRRRLGGASLFSSPYIAAVHPANPDVLYVRVQGPAVSSGFVSSHLLYSDDAGDSFRELFRAPADMLGFALAPDGETVYLGLGDSRELGNQRPVDAAALGLYTARPPDFSFTRIFEGQIGCLTASAALLFACGGHFSNGFELGVSDDGGRTFRPILDFGGIQGPLECPASAPVTTRCGPAWPAVCDPIGSCPAPVEDAGTGAEPVPGQSGCCGGEERRSGTGTAGGALMLALGASLAARRARRR